MTNDSVSIVIPTYNRCDTLHQILEKCANLTPGPDEVIVVDDASTDDTKSLMHIYNESRVKYIRLPENAGQAYARSVGMSTARGEIIVSLDDDAYFLDDDALARIIQRFESHQDCGILTFRVFTPRDKVCPAEDRMFYVSGHLEGSSAYRKSLLDEIGYHLPFIHSGGEGTGISLKTLNAGYSILLDHNIRVFHDFDPSKRSRKWHNTVRRQTMRNDLLEVWVRFPWPWIFPATIYKVFSHFRFGLKNRLIMPTIMGFGGFLIKLPKALAYRKPVSPKALKRFLELRRRPIEILTKHSL